MQDRIKQRRAFAEVDDRIERSRQAAGALAHVTDAGAEAEAGESATLEGVVGEQRRLVLGSDRKWRPDLNRDLARGDLAVVVRIRAVDRELIADARDELDLPALHLDLTALGRADRRRGDGPIRGARHVLLVDLEQRRGGEQIDVGTKCPGHRI